jgi:hypothetical protein
LNPAQQNNLGCPENYLNSISHFSSSWVQRSLLAKFQLPSLPGRGSSMVGETKKQNSVELEASLAQAEAEVRTIFVCWIQSETRDLMKETNPT